MSLQGFFIPGPYDDGDAVTGHYYEAASADPTRAQVWGYSDKISYAPGEVLRLYAMASAAEAKVEIARDGLEPEAVLATTVATRFAVTPPDCSVTGCDWPQVWSMVLAAGWQSGVYTITLTVPGHQSQHMFVLRAARRNPARVAMIVFRGAGDV